MPGRKDQTNRELKKAAQPCSKLTNIFKKFEADWRIERTICEWNSRHCHLWLGEWRFSYLVIFFYDGKILPDFKAHY